MTRDPRGAIRCGSTKDALKVLKFPEIQQEHRNAKVTKGYLFFPSQLYSILKKKKWHLENTKHICFPSTKHNILNLKNCLMVPG